jgi:hypothetical protein
MRFEEFRKKVEIKANVRQERYVIGKVKYCPKMSDKVFAVVKNGSETTIVIEENYKLKTVEEEKFFKIISFETKLPPDLTGFLAYMAKILADQNIGIFALSSYSTDHILIKENDLNKALKTLKDNGVKII